MKIKDLFFDKVGLEIGGPSPVFKGDGICPIYPYAKIVDGCNFSEQTIWEGSLKEGLYYNYGEKIGQQWICDVVELESKIVPNSYDFVISSNNIEHVANPLKAIQQCLNVMKNFGILLLVVPIKTNNFDHNRTVTSFDHLKEDFENNIKEDDLTHLDEILKLHDLALDPPAGTLEQFRERSLKNYQNRALHQHVFDMNLLVEIFNFFNLNILFQKDLGNENLIIGQKR